MTEQKRVGLGDIARGVVRCVPDTPSIARGLYQLVTIRPGSQQSIGRVIEHWADKTPNAPALRFEGRTWSYGEFNAWVNRIAAALAADGIAPGQTVAVLMENRPEALACVAAALKLGAVAGLLNHNQRGDVLRHSIDLIGPSAILISAECAETLASADLAPDDGTACRWYWHGGDDQQPAPPGWQDIDRLAGRQTSRNPASTGKVRADQPCFYIFTSGTTGLPKASVMTHYRWLSAMGGVGNATLRLHHDDVFYVCLPLYHNNALTVSWSSVLAAGACLALDRKFSASRFWDRVRDNGATAFCYIGELLRYLLNQPPSGRDRDHAVRLITGNGLRPEIWADFEQRFGIERIYEFYGASESNIAFINAFGVDRTAGFTPMAFAVVDYDTDADAPVRRGKHQRMQRVGTGEVGLLISKITKRRPFDGYTDPEASERKLLRNVFRKGDCWLNTGDLVRRQGLRHIQFVDRTGDTFRWKGENVATGEVEGVLAKTPDVEHGAVYGVQVPGHDGRAGMAALTLKPDMAFDGQALAKHLSQALPAYAVPVFVRLREEQDTTGTFKYRKVDLKTQGFDPTTLPDPVYVLLDMATGYQRLTEQLAHAIVNGEQRL
ncbi:MAG: long-chain-acyl-CoA synthetase [Abyssibacter sp.]|uniref:long-chain-acyl-CoA synthetase n=1 Tax=Abyssibacter sp. TaxID=2320200 RepID=UPI003219F558